MGTNTGVQAVTGVVPAEAPARLLGLDRLRGLAIAVMVLDHLALFSGDVWLRVSAGRLAVPLFFVVAGALVAYRPRLTPRHGYVLAAGLTLPLVVPWIDSPNVLAWYVGGAVVLVLVRAQLSVCWVLVAVALTAAVNGWVEPLPGSYDPLQLLGLMCLGAVLGVARLHVAGLHLPSFLAVVGRFPLSIYLGHVLALEALRRVVT